MTADVLELPKQEPVTQDLYRFYGDEGLVYLGRSRNAAARASEHRYAPWSDLWHFMDRESLTGVSVYQIECWEQICIAVEDPSHNRKRWKPNKLPEFPTDWSGRLTPAQFYEWRDSVPVPVKPPPRVFPDSWKELKVVIWYFIVHSENPKFPGEHIVNIAVEGDMWTEEDVRERYFMGDTPLVAAYRWGSRDLKWFAAEHRVFPANHESDSFAAVNALRELQEYNAHSMGLIVRRGPSPFFAPMITRDLHRKAA